MIISIAELQGVALDWAVAKAVGVEVELPSNAYEPLGTVDAEACFECGDGAGFMPSTDWSQGGPLIERYCVGIAEGYGDRSGTWLACIGDIVAAIEVGGMDEQCGPTPLISAMRAIVADTLGDTVDVPGELS